MKIIIDDVGKYIEEFKNGKTLQKIYSCRNPYEFDGVVKDILTENQYCRYIAFDTHRIFTLSKKKQKILLEYV